jgi:hypothetical protein
MEHYRFRYATVIAVCSLFVLVAYAHQKDFWASKPYTDWSAKEVEKLLLKDSPWTQTLLINAPSSSVQIGSTSSGGGGGRSGGGGGGGGGGSADGPPIVIINWFARPIREATVRQLTLVNPKVTKEQLDRIMNRNPQFIELLVTGFSMARGGDREAEMAKFKADTFLQKKNGEKIPLAGTIMPRGRDEALTLQFLREVEGKPVISTADQEVTLSIRMMDKVYKFKFKLKDMMIGDKLEL